MSALGFVGQVVCIALGIALYRVSHHFWGWPGVVAALAICAAAYFAADSASKGKRR